jgi:hypothetical protein
VFSLSFRGTGLAKVNNPHRKKAVGKWSADSLPTAYRPLTDSFFTVRIVHFSQQA